MHDCNKQLKLQQQQQQKTTITHPNNYKRNNHHHNINYDNDDDDDVNNNTNLYNLQQLLQFKNAGAGEETGIVGSDSGGVGIGTDVVDGVDKLLATTTASATAAAATVQEIQNLQLTQWWFLMMQQTIFNFKTTFEQHQQVANLSNSNINNNNNNFSHNDNGTVAASSLAGSTNYFDILNFINAVDDNDHQTMLSAVLALEQQQQQPHK